MNNAFECFHVECGPFIFHLVAISSLWMSLKLAVVCGFFFLRPPPFFILLYIAEGVLWTLRFLWRKVAWETFPSFLFELPYTFHSALGMGCLTWFVLKACRNWTYSFLFHAASDNSALVHGVKWGVGARGASQSAIGVGFYQAIKTWLVQPGEETAGHPTIALWFLIWFKAPMYSRYYTSLCEITGKKNWDTSD